MLTVVTSFSELGWNEYAQDCIRSFRQHWPETIRMICYWEGHCPDEVGEGWNLELLEPCASFIERHRDNLIVQGKSQSAVSPWGAKARAKGYSFRHDAYKFGRKAFAVCHAARTVERGRLFWIDADVVTRHPIDAHLLFSLLPESASLCYLARPGYHSELGFVGYNLDRPETHEFLREYEQRYSEDLFVADPAWDDCHQFDYLVARLAPSVKLIPHRSQAQPFDNSQLGLFMTHNKGLRKCL